MPILIIFVVIPIAEMWLLIEVGQRIGSLPTIGLVLLTAVIGVALLKQQGFSTLARAQKRMQSGEIPAQEMGEGLFLAVGGALLLTPGFLTDFFGFCCLIPGLRQALMGLLLKRFNFVQMSSSQWHQQSQHRPRSGKPDQTLEGEYRREDE